MTIDSLPMACIFLQGVQLYIEVRDHDPDIKTNDPELIDIVLINHRSAVGQASRKQSITGVHGFITMDLSITALCAPNFVGADCTQCVTGFTGPNCDTEIDNSECVGVNCSGNGECSMDAMGNFHCTCDLGFTGELCQTNIDDCVGVNCSGNGECFDGVNDFMCECISGYGGPLCSEGWYP